MTNSTASIQHSEWFASFHCKNQKYFFSGLWNKWINVRNWVDGFIILDDWFMTTCGLVWMELFLSLIFPARALEGICNETINTSNLLKWDRLSLENIGIVHYTLPILRCPGIDRQHRYHLAFDGITGGVYLYYRWK